GGYLGLQTFKPLRDHSFFSSTFRAVQERLGPLARFGLPVPAPFIEGLDRVLDTERTGANVYLLGQFGQDDVPGRRIPEYFLVAWLYKLPIGTPLLLLLAAVGC